MCIVASKPAKPVMFPTRAVDPCDNTAGDGIARVRNDDRDRPRLPLEGSGRRDRVCQDDVGLRADQLPRERSHSIAVTTDPPLYLMLTTNRSPDEG